MRDRIEVPSMVDFHYRNPPNLLPTLRELLRAKTFYGRTDFTKPIYDNSHVLSMIDDELKAISVADEQLEKLGQPSSGTNTKTDEHTDAAEEDQAAKVKCSPRGKKQKASPKKASMAMLNKAEEDDGTIEIGKKRMPPDYELESKKAKIDAANEFGDDNAELIKINNELQCFDDSLIKMLAYQRLQQILAQGTDAPTKNSNNPVTKAIRELIKTEEPVKSIPLPSQLLTKDDIERIAREFTSPKRENSGVDNVNVSCPPTPVKVEPKENKPKPVAETDQQTIFLLTKNIEKRLTHLDIRARAVMTPVDVTLAGCSWFETPDLSRSVHMRFRSISIGSGLGNDVQLTKYGSCRYISDKHATIFYDEVTKMFELLNYSEFGTVVNGQLFSCDFTDYSVQLKPEAPTETGQALTKKSKRDDLDEHSKDKKINKLKMRQDVMDMIDSSRRCKREQYDFHSTTRMANITHPECDCTGLHPKISGWEGTAILYQGTLLKFGCLSFVFTITDYDNNIEEFDDTDDPSEEED